VQEIVQVLPLKVMEVVALKAYLVLSRSSRETSLFDLELDFDRDPVFDHPTNLMDVYCSNV
jgi:hypothetical protein